MRILKNFKAGNFSKISSGVDLFILQSSLIVTITDMAKNNKK
jgi:hypothetical protein